MDKQKVTREKLLKILNDELSKYDDCIDCHFTAISQHAPDSEGRNWFEYTIGCSGRPTELCVPIAAKIVSEMRNKYILV